MATSLATKYRPKTFDELCGQNVTVDILKRQVANKSFGHSYLFVGKSGAGKTSAARLFANMINNGAGNPIEIDAASNNGVDAVRSIVEDARLRSFDSEYKVIIEDEAHANTSQAWQALLKCIEEPPKYTIFIFCTTESQKIPQTIINRCQKFTFGNIPSDLIEQRLKYICSQEGFSFEDDAINYIAKISNGGMRDAITNLETCSGLSTNITLDCVIKTLGVCNYDTYMNILQNMLSQNAANVTYCVDNLKNSGKDLKVFLDGYTNFILEMSKYVMYNKNMSITNLPNYLQPQVDAATSFENALDYYMYILNRLISTKNEIKNNTNIDTVIIANFMRITACK